MRNSTPIDLLQVPMYLNRQRTSLLFTVQLPVKTGIASSVWYVEHVLCSRLSVLPTRAVDIVLVNAFVHAPLVCHVG